MSESSTPDFHPTNFFPLRYEKDPELMVFENQRKSILLTLRAKRATFTFSVEESSLKLPKMVHFDEFLET